MGLETPKARYQQIADILRTAIESGEYPAGSALESTSVLAERFGVTIRTVDRAVLSLRAAGLVRVERGNRTVVRELPVITRDAAGRFRIRAEGDARGAFQAELARLGLQARSDVTAEEQPASEDIAGLLGIAAGEMALARGRRMFANDIPVQLAVSWIPLDIAAGTQLAETDTGPGGSYSRLADLGHPVADFTETVLLRLPDDDEREFLRMDVEQRVYMIRREARDQAGRTVEVTDTILPAHQWQLVYTWPADR